MTRTGSFYAVVLLLTNSAIAQTPKTDRELAGLKGKVRSIIAQHAVELLRRSYRKA